ncbi:MAG: hypothetical protein NTW28_33400 [Candidatus Solibacter sp.]|nr:hypothetical protein [Candidatus Solibacter sp.]
MKGFTARDTVLALTAIGVTLAASNFWSRWRIPKLDTPYQAVLLTNGATYIGRMQGLGTPYPVLRDVFYIQTKVNSETNQTANVITRRDAAWHSPPYMILDEKQIVMIEPVGVNSKVAELINENSNPARR